MNLTKRLIISSLKDGNWHALKIEMLQETLILVYVAHLRDRCCRCLVLQDPWHSGRGGPGAEGGHVGEEVEDELGPDA